MKKKNIIVGVIVIAIVIVVAILLYTGYAGYIDEWLEHNETVDGQWKQEILFTTADGNTITPDSLTLYQSGEEIVGVTLKLYASATTPEGYDPWQQVEIDIANSQVTAHYGTIWSETRTQSGTISHSLDDWFLVYDESFDLESASDDSWEGTYDFSFTIDGYIQFRGKDSPTDVGDWNTITETPNIQSFELTYQPEEVPEKRVIITWDTDTEWSYLETMAEIYIGDYNPTTTRIPIYINNIPSDICAKNAYVKVEFDDTNSIWVSDFNSDWTSLITNWGDDFIEVATGDQSGCLNGNTLLAEMVVGIDGDATDLTITQVELLDTTGNPIPYTLHHGYLS